MAPADIVAIDPRRRAESLNRDCFCVTLDRAALVHALESDPALRGLHRDIVEERPHLFAATPFFISAAQAQRMAEIVHAVEAVVALPAYRERVLEWAPEIARFDPGPHGVFYGYDFHLADGGPQLIEINTNAGGALLNTTLARAQRACCAEMEGLALPPDTFASVEQTFVEMFREEWRLQCGRLQGRQLQRDAEPLSRIAIVDAEPERQYLNPEFRLFKALFERAGLAAWIVDPRELALRDDGLYCADAKIDLVYNRLTDFSLEEPDNATLRDAYLRGQVVLTPHPRAHALYADKRNLVALTDEALLRSWNVPEATIATLTSGIPRTELAARANADDLWARRRQLFFKPSAGYGSRAAYRGDKVTKRVWEDILAGGYVAQEFAPAGERRLQREGEPVALKVDVRNYVYDGRVQLLAARLYQGQTTNFRTAGGGFASVFVID